MCFPKQFNDIIEIEIYSNRKHIKYLKNLLQMPSLLFQNLINSVRGMLEHHNDNKKDQDEKRK